MIDPLPQLIHTAINASAPILLAALGLLINERAGVLNLGAEGMMLVAAVAGFAVGVESGSIALALAAGALAGMAAAAVFGFFTLVLTTNQVATGLALSIFGGGLSAFVGQNYVGKSVVAAKWAVPGLSEIPFFGEAFLQQHYVVYLAFLLVAAVAWFLFRTRAGLTLRAVGESPESAHALGYPVRWIRFAAIVFGGACCGVAGAYLSTVYTPLWVEGMVAGRGWIALALTTFATWRPVRVALGALIFGTITILGFHLQSMGVEIPSQFLAMMPYLATIIVLVMISHNSDWIRLNMPASLGKPFRPGVG